MVKDSAPVIEVGIIRAGSIAFNLEGSYEMTGLAWSRSGKGEANLEGGNIMLTLGEDHIEAGTQVIIFPVDPERGVFVIRDVVIGIGFHWEQKEDQLFRGALKLMVDGDGIQVVNVVPLEDYLISVISSEMRGDSAPELLKAHTIISRSWLLAQIKKQDHVAKMGHSHEMVRETPEEYIRWYDREDHQSFHVCADDHCQRYQGITRAGNPEVVEAVRETSGQVLTYRGKICDARFSKCCGGVAEKFENCWEPVPHPYLQRVDDNPQGSEINREDLKTEANAVRFIHSSPEAFCNTGDEALLRQVLNDYDQHSKNFFRWRVEYSQQEIAVLIRKRSGIDFGEITDLLPVERGESGRLVRLKVVGTKRTLTVGKELEIRRWLSESHLYSSAFTVEKQEVEHGIPGRFILRGAGWGHGVGLCQIGAAVMAARGYSHGEILSHYFIGTTIEKRYEQS